jgi:hypothetical protein
MAASAATVRMLAGAVRWLNSADVAALEEQEQLDLFIDSKVALASAWVFSIIAIVSLIF